MKKGPVEQLLFLISLRIFPGTPNWLLNMAAPVADVPLHLFFVSVLIGKCAYYFQFLIYICEITNPEFLFQWSLFA